MRSFIQEREALIAEAVNVGAKPRLPSLVLVTGYRCEAEELCTVELDAALASGVVTEWHRAISRPTPPIQKRYVQDVIRSPQVAARLRELLMDPIRYSDAAVYVCGGNDMAIGVAAAVREVIDDEAWKRLDDAGRYHAEIFSPAKASN